MKGRFWKKAAALGVTCAMAVGMFSGCGSKASSDTSYTMWLYSGADASYYTDYADNPVVRYLTSKTWGEEEKTVDIEFWVPASGTATDSYATMMGSGDYPDILDMSISDSPAIMYQNGILLDLTEYVEKYMPNYMAVLEANPVAKAYAVSDVDGEEKYLTIIAVNDDYDYTYCGYSYRRDWLVKYGKNPQTGAAFTGGYTDKNDPDSWEDDVVFPSGGADPVYISDWEWMFDIFVEAQKDLGITDSYAISMYYPGYTWTGDLISCFGGGNFAFSKNADGEMVYGAVTDSGRAYLECMSTWYDKGWLDQSFNERTADMFYQIDDNNVRQGKVGMWCGVQSELGGRLDLGDEYTEGIYVAGCALPINDEYGTDACKNMEPNCIMTGTGLAGTAYGITSAAAEKDIPTLLTMIDYLYSDEGAVMRSLGLNKEQAQECGATFYEDNGVPDGMYKAASDGRYAWVNAVVTDGGGLKDAGRAAKLPGLMLISSIDNGYADTYEHSMELWIKYKNTGQINGTPVTNNMTDEDNDILGGIHNKVINYTDTNAVRFIKGEWDITNDSDWETWCKSLKKLNYEKALKVIQPYADKYQIDYDTTDQNAASSDAAADGGASEDLVSE